MAKKVNPYDLQFNEEPDTSLNLTKIKGLSVNPYDLDFSSGTLDFGQIKATDLDEGLSRQTVENIDRIRAERQSAWSQAGAALNQAVLGEIVGGTIEGIGYLLDFEQYGNIVDGTETEWGNWFSDIGKDLKTWTREVTPVYQNYNSGEFRPDKWSWWMTNAPSVASTLSLMIPATGAVKGISMLGKAMNIGQKMGKTATWMTTGIGQAVVSRHMENMMESSQLFDEKYEAGIEQGLTKEEAIKVASIGASRAYGANWIMLVQDIPEYLLLGGIKPGKAALSASVERAAGKAGLTAKLAEARVRSAGNILKTVASEGAEEAYQYIVSEEAGRLSDLAIANKEDDGTVLYERFQDYMKDGELWTSAFFGAIGGGVMQVAGRPIQQAIMNKQGQLSNDQLQVKDIQRRGAKKQAFQDIYDAAVQTGDKEAVERALLEITTETAMDAATIGTTEKAIDFLNQLDISDEHKQTLTKQFTKVKELYDTHVKDHPPIVARRLTRNDFLIGELEEKRIVEKAKGQELSEKQVLKSELSITGNEIYNLQVKSKSFKDRIKVFETLIDSEDLTPVERKKYAAQLKRNKTLLSKNEVKIEQAYNSYIDTDQKTEDTRILDNIDDSAVAESERKHQFLVDSISSLQEENKKLKDPDKQEKYLNVIEARIEKEREEIRKEVRKKATEERQKRINKIKDTLKIKNDKKPLPSEKDDPENIPDIENKQDVEETEDTPTQEEIKSEEVSKDGSFDHMFYGDEKEELVESEERIVINKVAEENADIKDTKNDQVKYEYKRSIRGHNLLAYLSRLYSRIRNKDNVTVKEITDDLNENLHKNLLHPDKYLTGTKITLKLANHDDVKMLHPKTKEETTWGVYKETIKEGSKEWINEIPIQILNSDDNIIGYLHVDSWVNEENIFGDVTEDKDNLNKVRKHLIKEDEFKTTIDSKSFGYLASTSTNEKDTLTNRMPDDDLIIGVGDGKNIRIGRKHLKDIIIANEENIISGLTYIVPKLGKDKNGNDVHYALPVSRRNWFKVGEEKRNQMARFIRKIMEVYIHNQQDALTEEDRKLKAEVLKIYNLNIYSPIELQEVMKYYIHNYHTNDKSVEQIAIDITNRTKRPPTLFSFNKTGKEDIWQMEFYVTGHGFRYINTVNTKSTTQIEEILGVLQGAVLNNLHANISANGLENNTTLYGMNKEGGLEVMYDDYRSYVKDVNETRLMSFEMEDGSYAYTVQSKIEMNFEGILGEKEKIGEEKKKDKIPEKIEDVTEETTEVAEIKIIKDEYTDKMGISEEEEGDIDLDEEFGLDSFDTLEDAQVEQIAESVRSLYVEPIGLTRQIEIVDMLHRNTVAAIHEGKEVRPQQAYQAYKELITHLRDNRQKNKEEYKANYKSIKKDPDMIKQMKRDLHQLKIFENILEYWDIIEKLAQDKLNRTTGIKVVKEQDNERDDNTRETESWNKEQYISDLKDSASAEVKAFLSNIRDIETVVKEIGKIGFKLSKDKTGKDQGKAKYANAYIGFGVQRKTGISSTGIYLKDAIKQGLSTNENIKPDSNTVAFVSVSSEGTYNTKTIELALKVIKAGGTVIMDKSGTGFGQAYSSFNKKGEGAVQDALGEPTGQTKEGYNYWGLKPDIEVKIKEHPIYKKNFLGEDKILSMDYVYNNLQSIITNLDADINVIIATLKRYASTTLWIKEVIEKLETSPEYIRKLFVTDMTNHYNRMLYIEWEKQRNKSYITNIREANSNAVQQILLNNWRTEQIQTKLIGTNREGEHTYNKNIKDSLKRQYEDWKNKKFENISDKEVKSWLRTFGIKLNVKTFSALKDGKYVHNGRTHTYSELFTGSNGLFKVIYNKIEGLKTVEANDIIGQGVIVSLAELTAEYTPTILSNSHRTGVKIVYSYGKNKYLVTRVRDLKHLEENGKSKLVEGLKEVAFSNSSSWLQGLSDVESSFYQNFNYWIAGLEPIKRVGSKSRDNTEMDKLSVVDIEAFKISMLQSNQKDKAGKNAKLINLVYPTTSDKTNVFGLTVERADIKVDDDGNLTDIGYDLLYDQLVLPEINRILHYQEMQSKGVDSNIANWEQGAGRFLFLPDLNDLLMPEGVLHPYTQKEDNKKLIIDVLKEYMTRLVDEKITTWDKNSIGLTNKEERLSRLHLAYASKLGATKSGEKRAAATDMIVQYLIGNANIFMTFIGDPANYFKSESKDHNLASMDTFVNIGKRLAGDVGPGSEADFGHEKTYRQMFLNDKSVTSLRIKELTDRLGEKLADKYRDMDGTDAQEFTTLKEHLRVMNAYGKIRIDDLYNKIVEVINDQIKEGNHDYLPQIKEALNEKEAVEFNRIIYQPTKPIFNGNILHNDTKLERRLYIKSSSLPLTPGLTKGFELDKFRIMMEKNDIDRAAFNTATKVGNVFNPLNIWNEDGSINTDFTSESIEKASLLLNRKDFRIQLEIPFKEKEEIKKVSQATKNLLVDLLHVEGFNVRGTTYNGKELKDLFNTTLTSIYKSNYKQLVNHELKVEFDNTGNVISLNMNKLRNIIKNEAVDRGYNLAEIESLNLDTELTMLAFSSNSKKFQALLNSIVENRILSIKIPGKSYILATEEGFQNDGKIDKTSEVKFTRNWTGRLLPQREIGGKILPAQIMIPWNIRDNNGNLVDVNDYLDSDGYIDTSKIDPSILEGFNMRIPNQGPNLQSKIEVVGFLPANAGDVMIASRDYLAQMGSDFDVDKVYMYKKNYQQKEDGTFGTDMFKDESKHTKKYRENLLVDIHLSIHSNPNEQVQKSIAEPLGFWKLPDIAEKVDKARRTSEKFTGLSDEYQRTKFITGVAGKAGTAVFSIDSVFHAMTQGLDLAISFGKEKDGLVKTFTIGKETSDGKFLNLGLDDKTLISDVIKGYQSAAVDNEKEQILSKLNVNPMTFKVISLLNELGFTTTTPYFIAQDIIVDYVNEIARLRGTGNFVGNMKEIAYNNVVNKYDKTVSDLSAEEKANLEIDYEDKLTPAKLLSMIEEGSISTDYNKLQTVILDKFIKLEKYAQKLATAQSLFNTDSAGMNKTLIESTIKGISLENLDTLGIENIENIFEMKTIAGAATSHGLMVSNRLWSKLFPFDQEGFKKMMIKAEQIFNKSDGTVTTKATFWNDMWEGIQSYLYTDPVLGLLEEGEDIFAQRERLFYGKDRNIHKSLSVLIKKAQPILNNPFLNRLETKIYKNERPSLVQFNASTKENADEINLYTSFIDLIVNNKPLDDGKKGFPEGYDTRRLAEDLIRYTYLAGGIQKATDFVKLIPVSYLHTIPFVETLSKIVPNKMFNQESFLGISYSKNHTYYKLPQVLVQYAQNNPARLTQITEDDFIPHKIKGKVVVKNKRTYVKRDGINSRVPAELLSIPTTKVKGFKKFEVLIYTGENEMINNESFPIYAKIDTLGIFGMPEYNRAEVGFLKSIIKPNQVDSTQTVEQITSKITEEPDESKKIKNPIVDLVEPPVLSKYEIGKGDVVATLTHILESENPFHQLLAEALLKQQDQLRGMKLEYSEDISGVGNFKVDTVKLKKSALKTTTPERLEKVVLHEIIHGLTVGKIEIEVIGGDFKMETKVGYLSPAGKKALRRLETLQKEYTTSMSGKERSEFLDHIEKMKSKKNDPKWDTLPIEEQTVITSKYYPTVNLEEFITMAMTDKGFQEILKSIPYQGKTMWEKFRDCVKQFLKALGIEIDTTLGVVMDDIMTLIEDTDSAGTLKEQAPIEHIDVPPEIMRDLEEYKDSFDTLEDIPNWIGNYPTKEDILKQFSEINLSDNKQKVLVEDKGGSSRNHDIIYNRVIKVNQGQKIWKATVGRQVGERLGYKPGKIYYYVKLDLRPEMNNISYRKNAITKEMLENRIKYCK